MLFHIRQVLELDADQYMRCVSNIDIPLLFINGEWDRYTGPADALHFADLARNARFASIAHTGHFLDMEHKTAWQDMRAAVEGFVLQAPASGNQQRLALAG